MYNETKNVPIRETEVSIVMSNLFESVERLNQTIDVIETRLNTIVRNVPSECSEKAMDPEYGTQHAQDINNINRKVVILRERLDSLLNRIEL